MAVLEKSSTRDLEINFTILIPFKKICLDLIQFKEEVQDLRVCEIALPLTYSSATQLEKCLLF